MSRRSFRSNKPSSVVLSPKSWNSNYRNACIKHEILYSKTKMYCSKEPTITVWICIKLISVNFENALKIANNWLLFVSNQVFTTSFIFTWLSVLWRHSFNATWLSVLWRHSFDVTWLSVLWRHPSNVTWLSVLWGHPFNVTWLSVLCRTEWRSKPYGYEVNALKSILVSWQIQVWQWSWK